MTPEEQIAAVADVPMQLAVELERRVLTVREILGLEVGRILELTRSAGENVDIYAGGELLGYGEIVVIETTMGVRVTDFKTED